MTNLTQTCVFMCPWQVEFTGVKKQANGKTLKAALSRMSPWDTPSPFIIVFLAVSIQPDGGWCSSYTPKRSTEAIVLILFISFASQEWYPTMNSYSRQGKSLSGPANSSQRASLAPWELKCTLRIVVCCVKAIVFLWCVDLLRDISFFLCRFGTKL